MALFIRVGRLQNTLLPKEVTERKVRFLLFFISKLNYFIPEKTEIFLDDFDNDPIETIDGIPKTSNLIMSHITDESNERILIRVSGTLKLEDKFKSYICLYNKKIFSSVYGDIEFDVYSKGNIGDLSDLIIHSETVRESLIGIIKELRKSGIIDINKFVIGSTPDSFDDMEEAVLIYYKDKSDFLLNVLKTLKIRAEEENKVYIEPIIHIRPYKFDIIARRVTELREFKNYFDANKVESKVEVRSGSMIIIAKEKDSSSRLYNKIIQDIAIPSFKELPTEDDIVKIFKNSILKMKI